VIRPSCALAFHSYNSVMPIIFLQERAKLPADATLRLNELISDCLREEQYSTTSNEFQLATKTENRLVENLECELDVGPVEAGKPWISRNWDMEADVYVRSEAGSEDYPELPRSSVTSDSYDYESDCQSCDHTVKTEVAVLWDDSPKAADPSITTELMMQWYGYPFETDTVKAKSNQTDITRHCYTSGSQQDLREKTPELSSSLDSSSVESITRHYQPGNDTSKHIETRNYAEVLCIESSMHTHSHQPSPCLPAFGIVSARFHR